MAHRVFSQQPLCDNLIVVVLTGSDLVALGYSHENAFHCSSLLSVAATLHTNNQLLVGLEVIARYICSLQVQIGIHGLTHAQRYRGATLNGHRIQED